MKIQRATEKFADSLWELVFDSNLQQNPLK